jgi:hypothetical protein
VLQVQLEDNYFTRQSRHFNVSAERFLLIDSGPADDRFIVFGREQNMSWAREMKKIYVDGTFKITPKPFTQVYVILAERQFGEYRFVYPILYALLPKKTRSMYERLFTAIQQQYPDFEVCSTCNF